MSQGLIVEVRRRRELVPGEIVELQLGAAAPDSQLPPWEPGAHIDLVLPSGVIRQYSLTGTPGERDYTIAVLRETDGRGGSAEVHDSLGVGARLEIRGPRNHFPLIPAPQTVLIAGGIGITPLLAMARQLHANGSAWHLHYGGRARQSMAYVSELGALSPTRITLHPQDEVGLIPLDDLLRDAPQDAVIFTCGPEPLLNAVVEAGARFGLPVHLERFAPPEDAASPRPDDTEFSVHLSRSQRTLTVLAGTRLIDVVRTVVPEVPFSCEEGLCGSCETTVLEGEPDHRDTVLTADERAANDTMMICVGRSKTAHLVLDL